MAESIGQGGMGRVWRAADEILDRPVAVKEMRMDGIEAEDARTRRERVLREARATARIDHPHVVRVYDVVEEADRLWIVMELVVGRSLEQIMAEEGPLSPRESARIGLGLVAALRQVHARGVLHRDIKPGNVLVESAGRRVVLTDFGIAAIQDAKALTMVGMLVGSPDYMAPERVSGRPQGPPSDIWSLGATLCAALAGRSPFARGTTLATLHAVLYEEPELPPAAGPLTPLLAALLEKEPAGRPGLTDIESALRPVASPPHTPTVRVTEPTTLPLPDEPEPTPAPPPATPAHPTANSPATEPDGPHLAPTPTPTPAPVPVPAPSSAPRSRSRLRPRTALLTAAAAVLTAGAVTAALLTTNAGGDGGDGGQAGATASASASGSETVEGTSRPPSLPPGARQEAGGFAWTPPDGWRRDVKTGSEVHYTAPDGRQELVAKSALARGDLLETWQTSERNAHQGENYRKIRLARTTFRDHPAVIWEYTFTLKDVPWHARLLGFTADGKSYQVNTWYQPETEADALKVYEKVKKSFTLL
ncbi:serine/threonine-protein kinase [Streptomyces sp. NPDC023723]|uniref:serine/threonine-protein kinase n=1 Tax=Streptomyces sp. NPDC023723 TaxID=3154323 RepID=UPI0034114F3B